MGGLGMMLQREYGWGGSKVKRGLGRDRILMPSDSCCHQRKNPETRLCEEWEDILRQSKYRSGAPTLRRCRQDNQKLGPGQPCLSSQFDTWPGLHETLSQKYRLKEIIKKKKNENERELKCATCV